MILLVLGVLLGVATLGLVHQFSMFGNTCYYIGEMNAQSQCIAPVIYYAVLGVAALLVLLGLVRLIRTKSAAPSN